MNKTISFLPVCDVYFGALQKFSKSCHIYQALGAKLLLRCFCEVSTQNFKAPSANIHIHTNPSKRNMLCYFLFYLSSFYAKSFEGSV